MRLPSGEICTSSAYSSWKTSSECRRCDSANGAAQAVRQANTRAAANAAGSMCLMPGTLAWNQWRAPGAGSGQEKGRRAMRKHSWRRAGFCLAALTSVGVLAAGNAADKQVSLTIYNKDLALVEHVRELDLAAGQQRIEFAGVSAQIVPETVSFV